MSRSVNRSFNIRTSSIPALLVARFFALHVRKVNQHVRWKQQPKSNWITSQYNKCGEFENWKKDYTFLNKVLRSAPAAAAAAAAANERQLNGASLCSCTPHTPIRYRSIQAGDEDLKILYRNRHSAHLFLHLLRRRLRAFFRRLGLRCLSDRCWYIVKDFFSSSFRGRGSLGRSPGPTNNSRAGTHYWLRLARLKREFEPFVVYAVALRWLVGWLEG